jgi:hypothetical protein
MSARRSPEPSDDRAKIEHPEQAPPMLLDYSPEMENQILGYIKQSGYNTQIDVAYKDHVLDKEAASLESEHLGSPLHRDIFRAANSLHARGEPTTPLLILDEMDNNTGNPLGAKMAEIEAATQLSVEDVNLPDYLQRAQVTYYVERVVEHWKRRQADEHRDLIGKAARSGESSAVLFDLVKGLGDLEADTGKRRFQILTAEEAEGLAPAQGILGNLLHEASIAFLYGKSGRWKSFLALAMAFAIAVGGRLFGRSARQAPVFYIAGEGKGGIGKRITALRRRQALQGARLPLYPIVQPINLLDASAVTELIAKIREVVDEYDDGAPPALIVFDTFAWSMPGGDENATKDINSIYAAAGRIRDAFGCCVLFIHHEGKDASRGARGSSAIHNNADDVLRVIGSEKSKIEPGEVITLQCDKPKDFGGFDDISFTAEIEKWATEDGQFHSSLVVVPVGAAERKLQKLTSNQQKTLDILLAAEPNGLLYGEWDRLTGLRGGSFGEARKALERLEFFYQDSTGRAHPTDDGLRHKSPKHGRSTGTTDHYETATAVADEDYYGYYGLSIESRSPVVTSGPLSDPPPEPIPFPVKLPDADAPHTDVVQRDRPAEDDICVHCHKDPGAFQPNYRDAWQHSCGHEWTGGRS